ncbi:heterokaryon incompatibility protein-domain-containing protein, partial [Podospora didyma]
DLGSARFWIQHCKNQHNHLCNLTSHADGLRFIDCVARKVVQPTSRADYAALSYRWPSIPPTRLPSLRTRSCPAVVRDSMEVTLSLGYRYLWVDMFCINQKDDEDKARQIGNMDLIYRGAELTIIAACDSAMGLVGVSSPRPEDDILRLGEVTFFQTIRQPWDGVSLSEWNTRAWTFQEALLSRRRLIFTESQALFVC